MTESTNEETQKQIAMVEAAQKANLKVIEEARLAKEKILQDELDSAKKEKAKKVEKEVSSSDDDSSDDDDDLVGKIICIKPNIWGQETLKNEYWKADTYHPTLTNKDVHTMDTEIFLIRKVIKQTIQKKSRINLHGNNH